MGPPITAKAGRNRKSLTNLLRLKPQTVLPIIEWLGCIIDNPSTEVTTSISLPLQGKFHRLTYDFCSVSLLNRLES